MRVKDVRARAKSHGCGSVLSEPTWSSKIEKNIRISKLTSALYMIPGKESGKEMCRYRSPECTKGCIMYCGSPIHQPTKEQYRLARTNFLFNDRQGFMDMLVLQTAKLVHDAHREEMEAAVRGNGTTDLPWERMSVTVSEELAALVLKQYKVVIHAGKHPNIMSVFPQVSYYDYTKWPNNRGKLPSNYELTFSVSDKRYGSRKSDSVAREIVEQGGKAAVVLNVPRGKPLPEFFNLDGLIVPLIDGDKHDYLPAHPPGSVIGLRAKGPMRGKTTEFSRQPDYTLQPALVAA